MISRSPLPSPRLAALGLLAAAALTLGGCDDGATAVLDGGPPADAADPRDGGPPDGDPPGPAGPAFFIASPTMDEVLAGRASVLVRTDAEVIAGIAVRVGDAPAGRDDFAGDRLAVDLDLAALPQGEQVLVVDALDAAGAVLGSRSVAVRIVADPPQAAAIDATGGALRTQRGVVVIVPPGAVDAVTRLRVQDRALDTLPDVVGDRPLELLQAIDLLPMNGAPDPAFRFKRPARILFPVEDTDDAQQVGSAPFVGNVEDGELRFVSTVQVGGGWAATGVGGAEVSGIDNLSRPGEPLRPLDLVALRGRNFPTKPHDLQVRLDGRAPINTTVGPRGQHARFVIPPGVTGDPVAIELVNRHDSRRQIVSVAILPRDEPMPSVEIADARLALLFDGLDAQIEQFAQGDYSDPDVPQAAEVAAMRAQLVATTGADFAEWRAAFADARGEIMALPADQRQQMGAVLAGLEENLAAIGAAGPLLITQDEACLSLLIMDAFLQYFDFVTGIIPDFTPPGLLKSALIKTAMAIVDLTAKSVGCDEDDSDTDDEGIWGHECDVLIRAQEEEKTAQVNGDVIGFGPRSPGGLGLFIGGQSPFDVFANTLFFLENIRINLIDPITGEQAALFNDVTNPDGSFTLPFVATDTVVDAVLTLPDGTQITIPIPTPGDGETTYVPIFIPYPDAEGAPPPADFPFARRQGAAFGLLDGTNTGVPAVADFDADGAPDVYFPAEFLDGPEGRLVRYLARNLGDGRFQSFEYGPFPRDEQAIALLHATALDVDGDGDLDLVGPGIGFASAAVQVNTGDGFVPGGLVASPAGPVTCARATGLAFGDFVAGDGPDIVMYSLPDDLQVTEPVAGARCVFANQGDGSFVQVSAEPLEAFGHEGGAIGSVADLDGDGHLDVYFDLLGIIAFGDGQGGFAEVRVPDACWAPNSAVAGVYLQAPAILDADRDGDLDLISPPKGVFSGAGIDQVPSCLLRNDGARAFVGVPTPAFDHPVPDDCLALTCTRFSVADVDADGFADLLMYHLSLGFRLAMGGPAGFSAGPLLEVNDSVGIAPGDFDGDGAIDFAIGSRDEADYVLVNTLAEVGGHVRVDLRDASGAPGGLGAQVRVDLDGDGDFETGPQAGGVGRSGVVFVGIGAAAEVDVEVRFVDHGAPGGNRITRRAGAGELLQIVDPQ